MQTTIATALAEGTTAEASDGLVTMLTAKLNGASPVLVLVFASTRQNLAEVLGAMNAAFPSASVLGASTAGEFTEERDTKGAVSALAVAGDFKVHAGLGLELRKDPEAAVRAALANAPADVPGYGHRTGILLLDPLSGAGEEATYVASMLLGEHTPLAGGAAGDDLKMVSTQIGLNDRVSSDAVVIATLYSRVPLSVGVCHGHTPLGRPMKVTKAEGNTVHEIDGRPAWDVWADTTREAAAAFGKVPEDLPAEDVGAFLLTFEAGLDTGGEELKIRAPLVRNGDGSLNFACGIPQGAMIRITQSAPERQIDSARRAGARARVGLNGVPAAGALVFDCICRNLILGSSFQTAVRAVSNELGDVPVAGFETYGEIALSAGDMSGFHNTTTVVLAFPR
jgi:methyl-accepting chemotaxis protein